MEPSPTTDVISRIARDGAMTETVVTTVAEANGVGPLDLEPLFNVIDPGILDAFSRTKRSRRPLTVEFQYEGCNVVVSADGEITVSKLNAATERPVASEQKGEEAVPRE